MDYKYSTNKDILLRDYFAAAAMQSLLVKDYAVESRINHIAIDSYLMADGMMACRDKTKKTKATK